MGACPLGFPHRTVRAQNPQRHNGWKIAFVLTCTPKPKETTEEREARCETAATNHGSLASCHCFTSVVRLQTSTNATTVMRSSVAASTATFCCLRRWRQWTKCRSTGRERVRSATSEATRRKRTDLKLLNANRQIVTFLWKLRSQSCQHACPPTFRAWPCLHTLRALAYVYAAVAILAKAEVLRPRAVICRTFFHC